jgi:NarL family two-component system response regulator LiaR
MGNTIRVSLCDSSPAIRCGLKQIFSTDPSIRTVAEFDGFDGLSQQLIDLDHNLVILDPDGGRSSAIECVRQFRHTRPDVKMIIFTSCNDRNLIMEAMELGVRGFKLKTASAEDIIQSVHTVHNGGASLDACVSSALVEHMSAREPEISEVLSMREQEVLALLATGRSNNDIAEALDVTTRTVKYHVSSIFSKLNVKNRTEAAARWMH